MEQYGKVGSTYIGGGGEFYKYEEYGATFCPSRLLQKAFQHKKEVQFHWYIIFCTTPEPQTIDE